MPMKQFKTVVADRASRPKKTEGFGREIEVEIDDRKIKFGNVTSGQMLAMIAMEAQSEQSRMATIINFFFSCIVDEPDAAYLRSRLFNPDDDFGEETMSEVVIYLLEEWSGRPTKPSSDSSTTQVSTGQSSTGNAQDVESTPSTSPSNGS